MAVHSISVILPCYNVEDYIEECLHSILQQSPYDLEVICIDDGSTDQTPRLLDEYQRRDLRVSVIHQPNQGVASARNRGLEIAGGEYIAWVDPDDYVSEDWYQRIHHTIVQNQPDLIVMDSVRFGLGSDKPEQYGRPGGFVDRDVFIGDILRDIRMLSGMPNKVIRATAFQNVRFDTSLSILEDYAAIPQILKSVKTVYYLPYCLYHYRQHFTSLLHHVTPELAFGAVQAALNRVEAVDPCYRSAAVTGAAVQALLFCRSGYISRDFLPSKKNIRFCAGYVRRNLSLLCRDPEVPGAMKVKFALLSVGLYSFCVRLRESWAARRA